jgi:signal transduction histidine kinase
MRKFIYIALQFLPCFLFSQSKTNELIADLSKMKEDSSKVNQYYKIAENYILTDSTKSFLYGQKSLELAKKINWTDGMAKSFLVLGANYNKTNNYPKALSNYNQALSTTNNQSIEAEAYFLKGQIYLEQSNYDDALAQYHKSLQLFENKKNKNGITKVLLSIGSLYTGFGKNKEALNTFNKALKISKQNNNLKQELALRGIGTVYFNFGEYEKSISYLEKSLALIKSKKDTNLESRLLSDIALVYLEMGKFQKAIDYSQASLKTDPSIMTKIHNVAFSYGVIGDSYVELAREQKNDPVLIDSAIVYLEKAVKLHTEFKSLRGLYDDYRSIYEAQKLKGNYAKALECYEICTSYKDSMYNSDNKETIKNLEDKRAIELRDREIKINKLKIETKEKEKWLLLSGIAFLAIIGGLLFYQSRNRKKTNEKLQLLNAELDEANKTKTRFFSILNHDLRSPVTNLIHFLHLQKDNPDLLDDESKKRLENKTILGAENLLTSMEDILLWSKGQMENFKPQPKTISISSIFDDTKAHFSSEENIHFQFVNPSNSSLVTDENYLKTIVRNLTGNAVKALANVQNPTISWKAFQENGAIILSISDNGPGTSIDKFKALYDDKEVVGIKTGLGLHLIRDLAKAIGCEITVDSKLDEGTTITLKL